MREDLKGRNLTFTEIAKLVGENWQNLTRIEKEPFETQAQEAKEKYNRDLTEYKKTENYRKYNEYLHEFRKRQAAQARGMVMTGIPLCSYPVLTIESEKDVAKRLKTDSDSTRGSSISGGGSGGPSGTASGAVSGSESQHGSEPPPSRQQRMGSSVSASEAQFPTVSNGVANQYQPEDGLHSPRTITFDERGRGRPRGLSSPNPNDVHNLGSKRPRPWPDGQHVPGNSSAPIGHLWLPQATDPRSGPAPFSYSPDSLSSLTPGYTPTDTSGRGTKSSASSISRTPSLKTEPSSTGSMSSSSSYFPRTPSDASLPIHALLSSKPEPSYPPQQAPVTKASPSVFSSHSSRSPNDSSGNGMYTMPSSTEQRVAQPSFSPGEQTYFPLGFANQYSYSPIDARLLNDAKSMSPSEPSLDGISALLKAKEIVDRRTS